MNVNKLSVYTSQQYGQTDSRRQTHILANELYYTIDDNNDYDDNSRMMCDIISMTGILLLIFVRI